MFPNNKQSDGQCYVFTNISAKALTHLASNTNNYTIIRIFHWLTQEEILDLQSYGSPLDVSRYS